MPGDQQHAGAPVPQPDVPRHEDSVHPLELNGWEQYSTWGFDTGVSSYFAVLYRNTDDPDEQPTVWLSGAAERYHLAPLLFARIVQTTGEPATAVYEALLTHLPNGVPDACRRPADPLAPGITLGHVEAQLDELLLRFGGDDTDAGQIDALQWVLGERPASPTGTVHRTSPRPSPLEIAAEAWAASAAIYQSGRPDRVTGAENALHWAAGWLPNGW
ncbi:hypothetical protein ACWFRQ_21520 [Streptomyces niveus]